MSEGRIARRGRIADGARAAVLVLAFLLPFLLGALAADPIGTVSLAARLRLSAAGAVATTFTAPDGSRLAVLELGTRSADVPVVLLHGLGAEGPYWTETAIALSCAGRTVLLPDAPGSGRSERPRDGKDGWGVPGRVAAVRSLLDALGLQRVDLVGHSLGGWTAGAFAVQYPRSVRHLVLVDAAGLSPLTPDAQTELKRQLSPSDRAGARQLYDLLFLRGPVPPFGFLVDGLARSFGRENVVLTLAALREADALVGREAELPAGTAFVWGEADRICSAEDGRAASARVPGGRYHGFPGVGHDLPLEARRPFDALLLEILGR